MVAGSGWLVLETVVNVAARIPWERFVRANPNEIIKIPAEIKSVSLEAGVQPAVPTQPEHTPAPRPPQPLAAANSVITRPGCTTADEALVVKGHLDGLARGWGGFGVLKTSKERLDKAVIAAKIAGAPEVSAKLADISEKLPEIKTPERAQEVALELDAVLPEAWSLGRRCKGLTPEMLTKARELAGRVSAGELTKEQAIAELSET